MQLARTLFLSNEKAMHVKLEVFIATAMRINNKDAILNMYLNEIYMGRGRSGMSCARSYFGKDLFTNKAEMAMLVGMIQAPSITVLILIWKD